jgi:DNA primase
MSGIIPKRILEDIRFNNDIAEVIGSYFTLKPAGGSFKACCPFHKEKTPSFTVNPQRQIYHCFGCGAGGDVFAFLMQHEGVDFITAARMLAQRAGIAIELDEQKDDGSPRKDDLYKIHEDLSHFYQRCLLKMKSAEHARLYLQERGLDDKVIEEFRIGFAPDRWDTVLQWGEKNKYTPEQLEACGLILKPSKPDSKVKFYDRFRNRLMFPIFDQQSRVIGFSGRALEEDPRSGKYINSPETSLFHKSRVLYALDKARRHIVSAESREAIVCEGQIDVIRCHQAGVLNSVAAQGTAFTEDHARILKRYADSVIVVFDTDKAGQDAAIKTASLFMIAGIAVRIACLPDKQDPDSFISEKGVDEFRAILKRSVSAVAFQIHVLSERENTDSEVGIMRTARAVLETINSCPSSVQQAKLIQEAAERLNLPASALNDDLLRIRKKSYPKSQQDDFAPSDADIEAETVIPSEEILLCEHIVQAIDEPELAPLITKYLPLDSISHPACRAIVEASLASFSSGESVNNELRKNDACPEQAQRLAARVQMEPTKVKGEEYSRLDAVKDIILTIWRRRLQKERKSLLDKSEKKDVERRHEITLDLKALNTWHKGSAIIEMELGH